MQINTPGSTNKEEHVKRITKGAKAVAVVAALSMIAAACGGDDAADDTTDTTEAPDSTEAPAPAEETTTTSPATDAGTGVDGGTLIWAHEQEPPDLHLDDPENNLSITSWIRSGLIEGLCGIPGGNDY